MPVNKAGVLLSRLSNTNVSCYYLSDDLSQFAELQQKHDAKIRIQTLGGLLDETVNEIKVPFLELLAMLNKEKDSHVWWGGQIASGSSTSTPLLLHACYLFCVRKILRSGNERLAFVISSRALGQCIADLSKEYSYEVINHCILVDRVAQRVRTVCKHAVQIAQFFYQVIQSRRAALRIPDSLPEFDSPQAVRRVLIRTWVTQGNFDDSGHFKERNFGVLASWLESRGYVVLHMPMFFNLSMKKAKICELLGQQKERFLLPDRYLRVSDCLVAILDSYRLLETRFSEATLLGVNISPIVNEAVSKVGLPPDLLLLNLQGQSLKYLSDKGIRFDTFYYPFEGNASEKPFILNCRKYYPEAKVIGFQHTTFFPNQLSHHLAIEEKGIHPLPDQLICSGPIYVKLHIEAGFPVEIVQSGPNLRFRSVHEESRKETRPEGLLNDGKRNLILPLTLSYDLAFELFYKVLQALKGQKDYEVYIRTHPLLSKQKLITFLEKIGFQSYSFADTDAFLDWLPWMTAVVTTCASMTVLEAVTTGVPVIRVVPDNIIFLDPFVWPTYPLKPVNLPSEIKMQLDHIDRMVKTDPNGFAKIGQEVRRGYFAEPSDENLSCFM